MKRVSFVFILVILVNLVMAMPFTTLGYVRVPTAEVIPDRALQIDFINYLRTIDNTKNGQYTHDWGSQLRLGLFDKIELGVFGNNDVLAGAVKVNLLKETNSLPSIAIGMDNVYSKIPNKLDDSYTKYKKMIDKDNYRANTPYAVMSKSIVVEGFPITNYLATQLILGVGPGDGRFKGLKESQNMGGFFMDMIMSPARNILFIAEMDGYNLNLATKYTYKRISFTGCIYRVEEIKDSNVKLALNISYLLDQFSKVKPKAVVKELTNKRKIISSTELKQMDDLTETLRLIREKREKAQKELEEIKKVLEDQ